MNEQQLPTDEEMEAVLGPDPLPHRSQEALLEEVLENQNQMLSELTQIKEAVRIPTGTIILGAVVLAVVFFLSN